MKEWLRWAGCFVLALAAHAAAVGAALGWHAAEAPYSPPPEAVMVELAPVAAAPETTPNEAPPAPDLRDAVPEPEDPPPVEIVPPDQVAIVLPLPEPPPPVDLKPPPPKPRPVEKPKPPQERKPPATAAAPQATPDLAPRMTAPARGATPEPQSAGLPTWKGLLQRHLERHKRYPADAQRQRHEGVVHIRFTLGRDGRVLAARLERPTGVASLDQEGLDLLQRAQPLPPFPTDQPGESLELVVPIQFFLKR